jgi:hypothetical protein
MPEIALIACDQGPHGAGWSSPVARQAHNLKVTGSNPVPATKHIKAPARTNRRGLCRVWTPASPTLKKNPQEQAAQWGALCCAMSHFKEDDAAKRQLEKSA